MMSSLSEEATATPKGRSPTRRDSPKRFVQKRFACFWILAALFPFMVLRLVVTFTGSSAVSSHAGIVSGSNSESIPTAQRVSLPGVEKESRSFSNVFSDDHQTSTSVEENDSKADVEPFPDEKMSEEVTAEKRNKDILTRRMKRETPPPVQVVQEIVEVQWGPYVQRTEHAAKNGASEGDVDVSIKEQEFKQTGNSSMARVAAEERKWKEREERLKIKQVQEQGSNEVVDGWGREQEEEHKLKPVRDQGSDELVIGKTKIHEHRSKQVERHSQVLSHQEGREDIGEIKAAILPTNVDVTGGRTPGGECDYFDGDWVYDPEGPLYTNSTCFYIQGGQNCMSNGRPDTAYLYWKWKPQGCDLPRFDAKGFLKAFRGKTIGFVGDSLTRNQMQSLLCMLSQVQIPTKTHQASDDKSVRWLWEEYQVTLAAVWSPYLLKESNEGIMGFEKGQSVLYVDELDNAWTSVMHEFDIIVLSIGQWYFKPSVYVKEGEVIGCHHCPNLKLTDVPFDRVYGGAVRQVLEKLAAQFKGVVMMSTFAISHFEDGPWDNGGQCRREKLLEKEEAAQFPGYHNQMHGVFMGEFNNFIRDVRKIPQDVKFELLDVTKMSLLRADGHPGPYRTTRPYEGKDPNQWVPNDCLHWCLPGPVDTWNQLVVKLAQKHFGD